MESIFLFGEHDRSSFLQNMMQYFNCTYICLWSYLPQPTSSCLLYLDGIYREINNNPQQPSSSSGSLAQRLFNTYCEAVYFVDNGRIPGFALKNNVSYMELKEHDFRRLASTQVQLQFYQEAGIKVEEERLMRKYYEFMAAQGVIEKKQCSSTDLTEDKENGQAGE